MTLILIEFTPGRPRPIRWIARLVRVLFPGRRRRRGLVRRHPYHLLAFALLLRTSRRTLDHVAIPVVPFVARWDVVASRVDTGMGASGENGKFRSGLVGAKVSRGIVEPRVGGGRGQVGAGRGRCEVGLGDGRG